MTVKEKAAAISIIANVVLTLFKFAAFFFTKSVAILAEAWHSFSDIATSILVFVSVRERPLAKAESEEKGKRRSIPLEYKISFSIGLFMFLVSILLMWKAFLSALPRHKPTTRIPLQLPEQTF